MTQNNPQNTPCSITLTLTLTGTDEAIIAFIGKVNEKLLKSGLKPITEDQITEIADVTDVGDNVGGAGADDGASENGDEQPAVKAPQKAPRAQQSDAALLDWPNQDGMWELWYRGVEPTTFQYRFTLGRDGHYVGLEGSLRTKSYTESREYFASHKWRYVGPYVPPVER